MDQETKRRIRFAGGAIIAVSSFFFIYRGCMDFTTPTEAPPRELGCNCDIATPYDTRQDSYAVRPVGISDRHQTTSDNTSYQVDYPKELRNSHIKNTF